MLDKKCLKCPVRKFALSAVSTLRMFYELNEKILETLEEFDTGYSNLNQYKNDCYEVVKNEYS